MICYKAFPFTMWIKYNELASRFLKNKPTFCIYDAAPWIWHSNNCTNIIAELICLFKFVIKRDENQKSFLKAKGEQMKLLAHENFCQVYSDDGDDKNDNHVCCFVKTLSLCNSRTQRNLVSKSLTNLQPFRANYLHNHQTKIQIVSWYQFLYSVVTCMTKTSKVLCNIQNIVDVCIFHCGHIGRLQSGQ